MNYNNFLYQDGTDETGQASRILVVQGAYSFIGGGKLKRIFNIVDLIYLLISDGYLDKLC